MGLVRGVWGGSTPERLQAGRKLVRFVADERVERVAEPSLPDKLECGAAHPFVDVEVCGTRADALVDGTDELRGEVRDRVGIHCALRTRRPTS